MPERECSTTWAQLAGEWPDPRARRGRRYRWATLLVLVAAAVASGGHTATAMAQWVEEHAGEWQTWLPTARGRVPSAATLRRVLRRVDVGELERRVGRWAAGRLAATGREATGREATGREATGAGGGARPTGLAADGKTLRGAKARGAAGAHLVSLVTHDRGVVLAQAAVDDKTNEIPALRALLAGRALSGWVVTADALHAQVETAALIVAQGGSYLLVVKANQPDRFAALGEWVAEPAWAEEREQTVTTSGKGHGRLERRTTTRRVLARRQTLEWPDVRQAARRETWARELASGHERQEVRYAVTNLPAEWAGAAELEGYWRGHWTIENRVHYVRDVDYREDAGQAHVGATHEAVAALCNGVLSQLRLEGWTRMACALRHLGASVPRVLAFLGCSPPTAAT